MSTLDTLNQYVSLGVELSAMLAAAGVESQHTSATVSQVMQVVSGVATVGTVLQQAHAAGGTGLLGAVLLGLQQFVPHLMPAGIQIVPVAAAPSTSVLTVPTVPAEVS